MLALEPRWANRDWKVGEVGLRGEEAKVLKKDERGEGVVMVVALDASEEENRRESESERLYISSVR